MEIRAGNKHLVRRKLTAAFGFLLGLGLAGAAHAQSTVQGRITFDTNFVVTNGTIALAAVPQLSGVDFYGAYPHTSYYGAAGSWQTALDTASAAPLALSDYVLAFKCNGTGPTCVSGIDQIYDNNNQDGYQAPPSVVAGGSGYAVNDTVFLTVSAGVCPVAPALTVTTVSGGGGTGPITGTTIRELGGSGRCLTRPTGTLNSTSSGAGTGATFNPATGTYAANPPTLAIGQASGTAITQGRHPYALTVGAWSTFPWMGGLNVQTTPGNTGPAFSVSNGATDLFWFDQSGVPHYATPQNKVINTTYNLTTASGNQAITGMGFKPSTCDAFGSTGAVSTYTTLNSHSDSTRTYAMLYYSSNTISFSASFFLGAVDATSTNYQLATIASYDSDGLTLTWAKTGSPTGTFNISLRCRP